MHNHVCDTTTSYPAGMKWTKQRKDVYHVLAHAHEPMSAVQIYQQIEKEESAGYALSTIYRILTAFEEKGYVSKSTFMGDGTVVYEWNKGEHTHYALCLSCHKRVALPSCPFEHVHLESDAGDFTVTGHKLELYGYCKDCEKQKLS
ncbi:MAG: transcriptional repressor [Lachnospiraceae bacterium]|nr:transcriptional repressor [Lachnospiraceae bacterium]